MKMDIDHETSHNGIGCGARAHEHVGIGASRGRGRCCGRFCRRQFERRRTGRKRHDHRLIHERYDNRELNDRWREQ